MGLRNKISLIQRLDISRNHIVSLDSLPLEALESLKELLVRQNRLRELPCQRLNQCKQLRLINAEYNELSILPPLSRVAFLFLRHNDIKLISSALPQLKLQGISLDWLQYLIENGEASDVSSSEEFSSHIQDYQAFKQDVVAHLNFTGENSHYFDFHACLSTRLAHSHSRSAHKLLALLTYRAIMREDYFFLEYLRDYHNSACFASMTHSNHLLLEYALDVNNPLALKLFQLCKVHYSQQENTKIYL